MAAQDSLVPAQPLTIAGATTHVYKSIGGVDLRLHVFAPPSLPASMPSGAIVFFFGGAWRVGTVRQFVPQSLHLAQRGMVAIVADYRVSGRHRTTPLEAMADARSAVRWVREHAQELGVDPQRIVASGGSAGGHLALSTALFGDADESAEGRDISSKPNALVLFNPAVDTSNENAFGARGLEGSPCHHLGRDLPPTVIFHGRADTLIPYTHVERFCARVRELGSRCELFGYEGAGHGFFNPGSQGGKWHSATLLETDRFLTSLGFLTGPPATRTLP